MTRDPLPPTSVRVARTAYAGGRFEEGARAVPAEVAVALTYDGSTQAVMMATPADLEDFGIGFSLAEGIVERAGQIESLEVIASELGIEVRMRLVAGIGEVYARRRRLIAGPTGCGLCGIESLEEAARALPPVGGGLRLTPRAVAAAMADLAPAQQLNAETRAVHGAAFWQPGRGLVAIREDVGRHNALDKLAGALARDGVAGQGGAVLLTSRVSVEMVQKTARLGAPILIAVSAPTTLAIRTAEAAGITLAAVARGADFEIFTRPERITPEAGDHVA